MKKIFVIFLAAAVAAGIFTSCNQDLLEIEQKGVMNTDSFYANADDEDAESLIAPVYRTMWTGIYGTSMYLGVILEDGDHLCGGGSYSDGGTSRYSYYWCMTPSGGHPVTLYTQIYRAIYWANMIVEKLDNTEGSAVKSRVIAEAKFLRAMALMQGIQAFGTPPFMSSVEIENPANGDPAEMWAWIEDNFNEAAAALPSKASKAGQEAIGGRATKEAALAYLGKAQLLQGKYSEASTTLQKVKSSELYGLESDFSIISKAASDWSEENIFEYNAYNDPTTYSTQGDMRCMYLHTRSSFCNVAGDGWGTGWGFGNPSLEFVEFMKEHDAASDGYSSRFNATMVSYNDYQAINGANGLAVSPWIDNVGYIGRKFYFWKSDLIEGSGDAAPRNARWHKNWVYMRYSEVLLDIAEAEAWQGKTSGIGLECLNLVRERAGLSALSALSQDAVKDERRAELWGENGDRFYSLVRWGDAASVLKEVGKYRYEFYAPTRSTEVDANADYPVVSSKAEGEATGRKTFIVKYLDPIYGSTAGFKVGKDELWPFPESEILINPNLTQNPNW